MGDMQGDNTRMKMPIVTLGTPPPPSPPPPTLLPGSIVYFCFTDSGNSSARVYLYYSNSVLLY